MSVLLSRTLRFRPPPSAAILESGACAGSRSISQTALRIQAQWPLRQHLGNKVQHSVARRQVSLANRLPSKPSAASSSEPFRSAAEARTLAQQLALKKTPTSLYEAPSHFWYRFGCFSAGFSMVGMALYEYSLLHVKVPDANPPFWVPSLVGFTSVVLVAMGGYFLLGLSGIVRFIRVMPGALQSFEKGAISVASVTPKATVAVASSALISRVAPLPIHLEIGVSRCVPLSSPKIYRADPADLELPARFVILRQMGLEYKLKTGQLRGLSPLASQLAGNEAPRAQLKSETKKKGIKSLTTPFRGAFSGVRRALYKEGFVKWKLKDPKSDKETFLRMDIFGGWALDDGKTLDRLATINPTSYKIRMV